MSSPAVDISAIRDAVAALPREDWKYTDLSRAVEIGDRWAGASDKGHTDLPVHLIEQRQIDVRGRMARDRQRQIP